VAGDPQWTTLIALAYRGELMVGIVDVPAVRQRWWAGRGGGAFRDGQRVRVSATRRLTDAVVCDDWRGHIAGGDPVHPLVKLAAGCGSVRPHAGPAALAVACGEVDLALSTGGAVWEYAAPRVIVQEAGGRHTDLGGGARLDSGQVLMSNGHVHEQALSVVQG
jgi:histidinol-phosphatase